MRGSGIVTYGRPGGEHWPKLTMLETMGVIVREDHELEYLSQILPRWDTTFSENYRVELQLNDSVRKVLRPARWRPTLLFRLRRFRHQPVVALPGGRLTTGWRQAKAPS